MKVKIVEITGKNFQDIPRPADKRFNCQECFYWMEKRDGRTDLTRQKENWFLKKGERYRGSLGKLVLSGQSQAPAGYVQFGPISEFKTTRLIYKENLATPKNGWCIACIAIQSNYRGKGLAVRLVRNVLKDLRRRGVKTVDTYPSSKSTSLNQVSVGPVSLWEKCGFEKVSEIMPVKGEPALNSQEKIILMRKKL